jgi:hypothetical protein
MDLLFHEYASPFLLLDGVIASGRFMEFIDTFEKQRNERSRWEFYIHKLPPWDDTTWEDFNNNLDAQNQPNQTDVNMTEEQLETTIKDSYNTLKDFEISEEGRG